MQNAIDCYPTALAQAALPYVDYQKGRPHPRQPQPWKAVATPPLAHFIFLSMLFHALFVLLFGAPSGGSREGRAMWGSLQVVLQSANPEPQPTLKLDRGKFAAKVERQDAPKAPRPTPAETARAPEPRAEPAPAAPIAFPRLLDRLVAPDLKLEKLPPLRVPPPTETPFVPRPLPERTVPPVVAEPAQVAPAPPPAAPTQPVERPPVETVAVPVPVPATPPIERATPPVERPPVETVAVPVPAAQPIERATSPIERPPVEVPAIPIPPTQSVAPPRIEPAPTALERALTPDVPITPAPPPAIERPAPRPIEAEPPRRVESELPVKTPAAPSTSPFKPPSPAIDSREGAPSTKYDPTAPSLDLDAMRKRAGQIAREGSGNRAILPFPMPPAPERKSKEAIALEKARKPDCRTAYKEMGLLAIAPLIANEFGEGSCRW
jgi:hypothetical protein